MRSVVTECGPRVVDELASLAEIPDRVGIFRKLKEIIPENSISEMWKRFRSY